MLKDFSENLSHGREMNYKNLVFALGDGFASPDQMDLYRTQLRERRQKALKLLSEQGQHIRRLVDTAYPTVPADVKETFAKDHFIDAIALSDMWLRIKQEKPKNLNEAETRSSKSFNKSNITRQFSRQRSTLAE